MKVEDLTGPDGTTAFRRHACGHVVEWHLPPGGGWAEGLETVASWECPWCYRGDRGTADPAPARATWVSVPGIGSAHRVSMN